MFTKIVPFLIFFSFAGCTELPLEDPVVCPPDADVPRYTALKAVDSCIGCHSGSLEGPARGGAPTPINYDTHESAQQGAVVGLFAIERGTMPPAGALSPEVVEAWRIWSSCGRPE
jgi:hypothetical protein